MTNFRDSCPTNSWDKLRWATSRQIDEKAKVALVVLVTYDNNGSCYPSYRAIADGCGVKSRSTIQHRLERLAEYGLITIKSRQKYNGTYSSNEYVIHYGRGVPPRTVQEDSEEGCTTLSGTGCTTQDGTGVPPRTVQGVPPKSRTEGKEEDSREGPSKEKGARKKKAGKKELQIIPLYSQIDEANREAVSGVFRVTLRPLIDRRDFPTNGAYLQALGGS